MGGRDYSTTAPPTQRVQISVPSQGEVAVEFPAEHPTSLTLKFTAAKGTDSFTQRLGYLEPKGNRIQAAFHVEVGEYDVEVISGGPGEPLAKQRIIVSPDRPAMLRWP